MGIFVLDLDVNSMLGVHSGCKRVNTQIDLDFLAWMPAYYFQISFLVNVFNLYFGSLFTT